MVPREGVEAAREQKMTATEINKYLLFFSTV
jgi:hypothetical protein